MINAHPLQVKIYPPPPFLYPTPVDKIEQTIFRKKNIVTMEEVGDELHVKFPRNFSKL